MAGKVRLTQEEEVMEILRREGFEELTEEEVRKEPYKSTYALPECFDGKLEAEEPVNR